MSLCVKEKDSVKGMRGEKFHSISLSFPGGV